MGGGAKVTLPPVYTVGESSDGFWTFFLQLVLTAHNHDGWSSTSEPNYRADNYTGTRNI